MINDFKEIRIRKGKGVYDLTLEIAEEVYFEQYKSTNVKEAERIIDHYLTKRQDMGKAENININHDGSKHIIQLTTELDYNDEYP